MTPHDPACEHCATMRTARALEAMFQILEGPRVASSDDPASLAAYLDMKPYPEQRPADADEAPAGLVQRTREEAAQE